MPPCHLPKAYWFGGFLGGVESNEFVTVIYSFLLYFKYVELFLASALLLVWFDPCKGVVALATAAPLAAGPTFSFGLPVYLSDALWCIHIASEKQINVLGKGVR